jgi:anion-transporting  ArsA/GET3 family ATPase
LSGTQEYMAVEKLYELQQSGDFDLIVVDTPPAQHALDFMEAPKHLARLLDNRVFRLLMTPTRAGLRALEIGAQLMLRTIAKVAGGQVVTDTVQFFTQFEGMEDGFRARARRADELLHSDKTSFTLVCTPRRDTVEEVLYLATQLSQAGLAASSVVANRCYPRYPPVPAAAVQGLAGTSLAPLVANLQDLRLIGEREDEQLTRVVTALPGATLWRVPFLSRDVHDLEGLSEVVAFLSD